ncbi:30S ribosomal protein S6 [bacterium]|nr:30S ribosomal protein S6 [bacterium]
MRFYELTFLVSANASEEEMENLREKITSLVQKEGVLINGPFFQKRALAYPIKKQDWAIFGTLDFQMKPEALIKFERKLKSEPRILRYLLIREEEWKRSAKSPQPSVLKKKTKIHKREKVELKEIDKKLEEILGK